MSWEELVIQNPIKVAKRNSAVVVGCTPQKKNGTQKLVITVRPQQLSPPLTFWGHGKMVSVYLGRSDHDGLVRIVPGGGMKLSTMGGKGKDIGVASLLIPMPAGVSAGRMNRMPVEFDFDEGWLEITLPDWARVPPATEAAAAAAVAGDWGAFKRPAKAEKAPFRTAATNGHAPRPVTGGR